MLFTLNPLAIPIAIFCEITFLDSPVAPKRATQEALTGAEYAPLLNLLLLISLFDP